MTGMTSTPRDDPRPADWARLLLASAGGPPRARARDQEADRLGEDLRRQALRRLIDLDPDGAELDQALMTIVAEAPGASGPMRAIALTLRDEWEHAARTPALQALLLNEALRGEDQPRRRRAP